MASMTDTAKCGGHFYGTTLHLEQSAVF